ncbi:MAG: hypothetical protein ACOCVM_03420, partial [Desulfovibrionaceae bacterium]
MPHVEPSDSGPLLQQLMGVLPQWVLGNEEPGLQLGLAGALVRAPNADPDLQAAGAALALWAWKSNPLSGDHLKLAWRVHETLRRQPPAAQALMEALRGKLLFNLDTRDFDDLAQAGAPGLFIRHGLPLLRDERLGLFRLSRAFAPLLA